MNSDHLRRIAEMGSVPFDLDFLREFGFKFGQDWDGELLIEAPKRIDVAFMLSVISVFEEGISQRLFFERQRALTACVGGPMNGHRYEGYGFGRPVLLHPKRGQWHVYVVRSHTDPRAFFVGTETSRSKARKMWFRSHKNRV